MANLPITILWKNFHGETIYVEDRTVAEVLVLMNEDERSIYNRYLLPNHQEVDDMQFREWYVSQLQAANTRYAA